MTPQSQNLASVVNLLAHIDGSITRVCVQCGAIFKVPQGSGRMFCEPCQCEREALACCDAPSKRTIASRSDGDAPFATVVCDNCGQRKEIQL